VVVAEDESTFDVEPEVYDVEEEMRLDDRSCGVECLPKVCLNERPREFEAGCKATFRHEVCVLLVFPWGCD
jgi:hypothetical protein